MNGGERGVAEPDRGAARAEARGGLRAFALIAGPFFLLLAVGVGLVASGALDAPGAIEAGVARENRILAALRATPATDAGPLVEAWAAEPAAWSERQVAAFRALATRIAWPLDPDPAVDPARLSDAPPGEWSEAEQASAKALLDPFERRWPSLPRR